jgi:hypothetical protein
MQLGLEDDQPRLAGKIKRLRKRLTTGAAAGATGAVLEELTVISVSHSQFLLDRKIAANRQASGQSALTTKSIIYIIKESRSHLQLN